MGMRQKRCPACRKLRPWNEGRTRSDQERGWQLLTVLSKTVLVCKNCDPAKILADTELQAKLAAHPSARELEFNPDWVSPPGDTILDALRELRLTQAELVDRTQLSLKYVEDLVHGRAAITMDVAMKLEAILGGSTQFWINREAQYREALAKRSQR